MEAKGNTVWRQVFAAFGICYLCFSTGNMLGFTSPAIPSMRNSYSRSENNSFLETLLNFNEDRPQEIDIVATNSTSAFASLTDTEASWIGGLCPLGAFVGSFIVAIPAKLMGPKTTILKLGCPLFLSSWILVAFAPNLILVYFGRLLGGIGIGICTSLSPVYVVDIASLKLRGPLGTLPQSLLTTGILASYILGTFFDWRQLALICAVTLVPAAYFLIKIPESPAYLFSKNRYKEAEQSLQYFHGSSSINPESEILHFINNNNKIQITSTTSPSTISRQNIRSKLDYIKPIWISFGIMGFQQFCGMNAINFYAVSIFSSTGNNVLSPHCASIIVATFLSVTTYSSFYLIEKLGRKLLLVVSILLMCIADYSLGAYFYFAQQNESEAFKETFFWVPLVALVTFVLGFSIGYGPVAFIIVAEILPLEVRTTITSIAVGFNWLCVFGVAKTYPSLVLALNNYGTFWLYGILATVGLVFTVYCVPETKGKNDIEIQEYFIKKSTKGNKTIDEVELSVCMC